jgi:tRNA(adenine34) deaminase
MNKQHLPDDEKYMRRCLELAAIAKSNGKTPVGSLIVKDEKIIAEGIEGTGDLPALLAHAEVAAVLNAAAYTGSNDLSGCCLYTTVEPCFMCSYLIRRTRISRVIFGVRTSGTGGVSSDYPLLTAEDISQWPSPPSVTGDVLKEACSALLSKEGISERKS